MGKKLNEHTDPTKPAPTKPIEPTEPTFDQSLARLEEIVSLMEKNIVSLEESLELYKEGVNISSRCSEIIKHVEDEVTILRKSADGVFGEFVFDIERT